MKKFSIVVDLDGTVCDMLTPWFGAYNVLAGDDLRIENITTWGAPEKLAKDPARLQGLIDMPEFYLCLSIFPGAAAVLEEWNDRHSLLIATASGCANASKAKTEWVHKHLPFLTKRQLAFIHEKWMLAKAADVFIDDKPSAAEAFKAANRSAYVMGIEYPYNNGSSGYDVLAADYRDPGACWARFAEAVRELEK